LNKYGKNKSGMCALAQISFQTAAYFVKKDESRLGRLKIRKKKMSRALSATAKKTIRKKIPNNGIYASPSTRRQCQLMSMSMVCVAGLVGENFKRGLITHAKTRKVAQIHRAKLSRRI